MAGPGMMGAAACTLGHMGRAASGRASSRGRSRSGSAPDAGDRAARWNPVRPRPPAAGVTPVAGFPAAGGGAGGVFADVVGEDLGRRPRRRRRSNRNPWATETGVKCAS